MPGVANIGTRPTVDGLRLRLEVHLLDFDGDLYGRFLEDALPPAPARGEEIRLGRRVARADRERHRGRARGRAGMTGGGA